MVESLLMTKIVKRLEKYLIQKSNFSLVGQNYDLILIVPSEEYFIDTKYSILISSKKLDVLNQKDIIRELFIEFKNDLNSKEYNSISRINIVQSTDPLVKSLSLAFSFREFIIEIREIPIGGYRIDLAYLVKSLILDKLKEGQAITMVLMDGQEINAGLIRIEPNFDLVHYTGKGLREIWKPDLTSDKSQIERLKNASEEVLVEQNYISRTNLDSIYKII